MHAYARAHTYGRTDVRTYVHTFVRAYVRTKNELKKNEAIEKSSQQTPTWCPQPFKKESQAFQNRVFGAPKSSPGRFKKVSGHHEGFRNAQGVDPNNFFLKFWLILVPKIGPESEKKTSEKTCRFAFPFWVEFPWFRKAFWRHLLLRRKSKNELLV